MGYLFYFLFLILETDLPPIPTVNSITSEIWVALCPKEPGKIEALDRVRREVPFLFCSI